MQLWQNPSTAFQVTNLKDDLFYQRRTGCDVIAIGGGGSCGLPLGGGRRGGNGLLLLLLALLLGLSLLVGDTPHEEGLALAVVGVLR